MLTINVFTLHYVVFVFTNLGEHRSSKAMWVAYIYTPHTENW